MSAKDKLAQLIRKGEVSRKVIAKFAADQPSGNSDVTVSDWGACIGSVSGLIMLSCSVTANSSDNLITSIGLTLNDSNGNLLSLIYIFATNEMSTDTPVPILFVPGSGLSAGSTVTASVFGTLAGEQFFEIDTTLTLASC